MVEHIHGGFVKWIELHPGTASWVQAIGSVLALGVAIYIASSQSRDAKRAAEAARQERLDAVMRLAEEAHYSIKATASVMEIGPLPEYFAREHSPQEFEELASALLQASLQSFGSSKVVKELHSLRRDLMHAHTLIERVRRNDARWSQTATVEHQEIARELAESADSSLENICNERARLR